MVDIIQYRRSHSDLDAPEPEVVLVIQLLAAGELSEDDLAQWLKQYSSREE